MKQLNLYYLGGGGPSPSVPDGRTVTPTDDVTLWLECANIRDTGYTTVAEVIADTGVLTSVLTNDNANDYLARSTTFASDITADNLAMTTIGQNNYAANTLIDVQDWIDAIVASQYRQIVLNVQTPAMTNYTVPSGRVTESSNLNNTNFGWRAFDGNLDSYANYWHAASGMPQWLAYQFTEPKKIRAVYVRTSRFEGPRKCYVQYSDDGAAWATAGEYLDLKNSYTDYYKAFIIPGEHAYYRFYMEQLNSNYSYAVLTELDFYGREDV